MIFCTIIQMPKSSYHYCKIKALPHLWILFTSMYIIFSKTTSTENIIKYDTNSRTCIRLRKLHIHRSSYCHALQAYSAITHWNILLFVGYLYDVQNKQFLWQIHWNNTTITSFIHMIEGDLHICTRMWSGPSDCVRICRNNLYFNCNVLVCLINFLIIFTVFTFDEIAYL